MGCPSPPDEPTKPVVGKGHGRLLAIGLTPPSATLEVRRQTRFAATAIFEDGAEVDVTADVRWESSDESVVLPLGSGLFEATGRGQALVSAALQTIRGAAQVDVRARPPDRLTIPVLAEPLGIGDTRQLRVLAEWGEEVEDVTLVADWSVVDATVVDVDRGYVEALATGATRVRARYRGLQAEAELRVAACRYPLAGDAFVRGAVLPAFAWDGAFLPDCTPTLFDLESLYCDPHADIETIHFIVEPTTAEIERIGRIAGPLRNNGGLIVWLETTTATSGDASNDWAHTRVDAVIGQGPGIRAGDRETWPTPNAFKQAGVDSFVVRRRDMQVIAKQSEADRTLPLVAIAIDPDADWSSPDDIPHRPQCGPADEELGEPNDEMLQASSIGFGSIAGGVCDPAPDFFHVEVGGPWTLRLEFSHAVGDLDVVVWNTETDAPLTRNGNPVGSRSNTDNEQFNFEDPATVRVIGYQDASAAYTLTISPR